MTEPVSLAEAKLNLRVSSAAEDSIIAGHIVAAREWVEGFTGLILTAREIVQSADHFDGYVDLAGWPVRSVTSVGYLDAAGVAQTMPGTDYIFALARRPVKLLAGLGKAWPRTAATAGAVTVTYQAGYASPDDVPQRAKRAMLVLITSLYEERGGMSEQALSSARYLCRDLRRGGV